MNGDFFKIGISSESLKNTNYYGKLEESGVLDDGIFTMDEINKANLTDAEKKELATKYKNLDDDDVESMQYQMQLREKLKNKQKIGE